MKASTKIVISACVISAFILLITASPSKSSAPYSKNHTLVEDLFKSSKEPTTKDALWTTKDIFKVFVLDTGKTRSGYAMYVCEVLDDYGLKHGTWVQVLDIKQLVNRGKWIKLGSVRCNHYLALDDKYNQ